MNRKNPALVLAMAVCLIALGAAAWSIWGEGASAYALAEPKYPQMAPYETSESGQKKYRASVEERRAFYNGAQGLDGFFAAAVPAFLDGGEGENRLCSPVNVYMALAMLAEITDGETRAQVLELLGEESVETLREKAYCVWNACYCDEGTATSIPAASMWLREGMKYEQKTLDTLAEKYYASSFAGEMGSPSYDQALRDWIDAQTGGLLSAQTEGLRMDPDTVIGLVTTLWFKARWAAGFSSEDNTEDVFHGARGDEAATFMHRTDVNGSYWWGERFGAVRRGFKTSLSGAMWLILPDEGVTPEELLRDPEALGFLLGERDKDDCKSLRVNLTMPKFDVSAQTDLIKELKALGVTDCFDEARADFSPLGVDLPLYVSAVTHGARVMADEEGVEAAAFTLLATVGAMPPPDDEIDFTLDRPFLFVVEGASGLPLFVGIVNSVA